MPKLSNRNRKSGRSKNTGRPLLNLPKKGKVLRIRLSKRREIGFVSATYKKTETRKSDRNTKFNLGFFIFSRYFEFAILYKKAAYKGIRYKNSLSPAYLLSMVLFICGLLGVAYFAFDVEGQKSFAPTNTFSLPVQSIEKASASKNGLQFSKPKRIKISRVDIDYPVMELGKNPDGSMETPPLFDKVTGWYKYSPSPGEIGPTIITGHIDTYKGPSVFWRLRDLQPGDLVEVTREDSKIVKFKVTALKQFSQNDFPTQEVYGNTEDAELRLITCGGTFNHKTLQYSDNTVAFATIVR